MMILSYTRIALRNLIRHKVFSLINIFGLALGMAVCLIITLYIDYEFSFDTHFPDSDHIYRVAYRRVDAAGHTNLAITPVPLSAKLSENVDLCVATKLIRGGNVLVSSQEHRRNENRFFYADHDYFRVFSTPFLRGDPSTALIQPQSVVITRSTALRYFSQVDVIGQEFIVENQIEYTVTGVIEDYPANTHFSFDFLASISSLPLSRGQSWLSKNVYTYVKLNQGAEVRDLERELKKIVETEVNPQYLMSTGESIQDLVRSGGKLEYFPQALSRIYLWSDFEYELDATGDRQYIIIFSIAGIGILLVACFNFMNLATARYTNRYKEVGLRKMFGSNRSQLAIQFIVETVFLCVIALICALSFVEISLPLVNFFAGLNLVFSVLFIPKFLVLLLVLIVVVGCVAGSYPAIFLSSFTPIDIIKGRFKTTSIHVIFRKIMSVFQIFGLLTLFLCTLIIYRQVDFLGAAKFTRGEERIIVIPRAYVLNGEITAFRKDILSHPAVKNVTISRDVPGGATSIIGFQISGGQSNEIMGFNTLGIDQWFFDVYNIDLARGEFFGQAVDQAGVTPVVVNTTAVSQFSMTDPIGMELVYYDPVARENRRYTITGIVENFYFESLHQTIQPVMLLPSSQARYISMRISSANIADALEHVELVWAKFAPDRPFEYFGIEDDLRQQYHPEERVGQVFIGFTALSIMVACLGLIGLVAFNIERRTLEIGLRKVIGASASHIAWELSREIYFLLGVATAFAWPTTYFAMSFWLNRFAYHVSMPWTAFIYSLLVVVMVVSITIGFQVVKVALKKPVDLIYAKK